MEAKARLEALAQALADDYITSKTHRGTTAAMVNALPGIKFWGVGILSPNGAVVASGSPVQAGQLTSSIHAQRTSCMGMVTLLQKSMQGRMDGLIATALSDIKNIKVIAPETNYFLCLPLLPPANNNGVRGALLLGFYSEQDMPLRRTAGLTAMCQLLSKALFPCSHRVVCLVEGLVGHHRTDCHWCESDSENPAIPESAEESCHREDFFDGRGSPRPRASMLLRNQTIEEGSENDEEEEEQELTSPYISATVKEENEVEVSWLSRRPSSINTAAGPSTAPSEVSPAPISGQQKYEEPVTCASCASAYGTPPIISKSVLIDLNPSDFSHKHPLLLTYANPSLEAEFARWHAHRSTAIDSLFAMLVIVAAALILGIAPTVSMRWTAVVNILPLMIPLMIGLRVPKVYIEYREWLVVAVRLYLLALPLYSHVGMKMLGISSATSSELWTRWGINEALITPALGLQLRLLWHLPLQAALVLLSGWELGLSGISSLLGTWMLGCAVPYMLLQGAEMRARKIFESQALVFAGLESGG